MLSSISYILSQTPVKTQALSYQIPPSKMPGVELTSLLGIELSKYLCDDVPAIETMELRKKKEL